MFVRYSPIDLAHIERLQRRVESIPLSRSPQWGSKNAAEMFAHLRRSLELALGDYPEPDRSTWITRLAGRVMFTALPWPKTLTSPNYFHPDAGEGEHERRRLIDAMHEFAHQVDRNPDRVVASPLFGPLALTTWAKWQGRHLEHHLRQFGV